MNTSEPSASRGDGGGWGVGVVVVVVCFGCMSNPVGTRERLV